MQKPISVIRDFNGIIIPSAEPLFVIAGSEVELVQNKGNFATIYLDGHLVRVNNKDLDAIGLTNSNKINKKNNRSIKKLSLELIWDLLRECYDPEISVNIVDLGLVYDCKIIDKQEVIIIMTLTAPMCSMGPILVEDIRSKLLEIDYIKDNKMNIDIQMVFDPPWSIEKISEAAKIELGLI